MSDEFSNMGVIHMLLFRLKLYTMHLQQR